MLNDAVERRRFRHLPLAAFSGAFDSCFLKDSSIEEAGRKGFLSMEKRGHDKRLFCRA